MSALEKLVDGAFRALLICSAIYFGAKYAPYVMKIADNIKEKIIPGSSLHSNQNPDAYSQTKANGIQNASNMPEQFRYEMRLLQVPDSLLENDRRLYNAIAINRFVTSSNYFLDGKK